MDYVKLGSTGLDVSRICLGCMTFGIPDRGAHTWTLDEPRSRPLLRRAIELGINFFDTANSYSDGTSEEIVGRALRDFGRRDEVVLATKVFNQMRSGPNGGGPSRKAILGGHRRQPAPARNRLRGPLPDPSLGLPDAARGDARGAPRRRQGGKARYIGASSMHAWQFCKALVVARQRGWTPFVSMQNHYNLLYREEEREMLPLCASEGIGVIPWSPLARGRLTRHWEEATERTSHRRIRQDAVRLAGRGRSPRGGACRRSGGEAGRAAGADRARLGPPQAAPSPRRSSARRSLHHLEDAVAALALKLTPEEIAALEEPYVPHPDLGFRLTGVFSGRIPTLR